jgi:hypothetical protein
MQTSAFVIFYELSSVAAISALASLLICLLHWTMHVLLNLRSHCSTDSTDHSLLAWQVIVKFVIPVDA